MITIFSLLGFCFWHTRYFDQQNAICTFSKWISSWTKFVEFSVYGLLLLYFSKLFMCLASVPLWLYMKQYMTFKSCCRGVTSHLGPTSSAESYAHFLYAGTTAGAGQQALRRSQSDPMLMGQEVVWRIILIITFLSRNWKDALPPVTVKTVLNVFQNS